MKSKNTNIQSCIVYKDTKIILNGAFKNCDQIISLTLPFIQNGYLGYIFGASKNNENYKYVPTSLEKVTLSSGKELNSFAFYECNNLKEIILPETITTIGEAAFSGCINLNKLNIPTSVIYIGVNAFNNCKSLIYKEDENGLYLNYNNNEYGILVTVKDNDVTSFTINEKTELVVCKALSGCTKLKKITLTFIGSKINCNYYSHFGHIFGASASADNSEYIPTSLKEVYITGNTSIEKNAFLGCSTLSSITLPYIPGGYLGYIFGASSYGENSKYVPTFLKEVVISGDTSIGSSAFYGCSSLTSITLPYIPGGYLGYIFGASSYSKNSSYVPTSLKEVVITGDTSIKIPNSVTSIGIEAFLGCNSLENVYYNGTIEDWCNIIFDGITSNPMFYAQHIYMIDNNGEYEEVTEIEIPDTITKIGNYQFRGFNNVTKIILPNNVSSIGYMAFSGCSSLTSMMLPNSVTSIGKEAFLGCNSLEKVYYDGTIEDWCNINISSNPMEYAKHFYIKNSNGEYEEVTEIEISNTITKIGYNQFRGFNK